MNRVRVLHTVGNLELGGGQKLVALVAGALDPALFEVAVLSFGPPGPYGERLTAQGVQVIDLGLVRPLRSNRPSILLRAAATLVRTVVFGGWDIVHTHMFLSSVVVTPLARLGRARAFGTTHRIYYGRVQPIVERLVSLLQERIVVDSHAVREILRDQTHIPADKYVVIHNGIDTAEFSHPPTKADGRHSVGLPEDALVVGEVAHLAPHKGQRYLLEAVARLVGAHATLRVLLVGDGPDRSRLERLAEELNLADRVIFTGSRSDLPAVLSSLDILALPSTFEGFGIVQAEAMFLGIPVLATNHGGSTEVVVEGETGFLVPFAAVDLLADRLGHLLRDGDLRRSMGDAGRQRVLDRFTSAVMAQAYEHLYEAVPSG